MSHLNKGLQKDVILPFAPNAILFTEPNSHHNTLSSSRFKKKTCSGKRKPLRI